MVTVPRPFLLLLALVGVLLTLTVVPGVFTIDEDNYLVSVTALRAGGLTVPGTAGLPATTELAWFDPQGHSRRIDETPVAPTTPPLYAPLALPFSYLGWRGLVALNTGAFLATAALVFLWARRYADGDPQGAAGVGWLAGAAFVLGGHSIEYAQGMWPHMVSVVLCTGAAYLASRLRDGAPLWLATAAGLAVGWAAGIRYQNVAFAALVGVGILLFARNRWRASLLYAAGVALPLAASSLINHARLGTWNPVSKGARYLSRGSVPYPHGFLHETWTMLWARVVDYGQRPPPGGPAATYLSPDPDSGVYLIAGAVKKAWLQSSPWLAVALAAITLAWIVRRGGPAANDQRRELRAIACIVLPILALFAAFGSNRTDGLAFNQRYFLELVPLCAVAFAWACRGVARHRTSLAVGTLAGLALAAAALVRPADSAVRHLSLRWLPLLLAVLLLAAWAASRWRPAPATRAPLALLLAGCLAYSLGVHLGDDLQASRSFRHRNLRIAEAASPLLPDGAALFAFWGGKDPFGPLLLDRELVLADAYADRGAAAPALTTALLEAGRPVYVALPFPPALLEAMRAGRTLRPVGGPLLEIRPAPGEGRGGATAGGPRGEGASSALGSASVPSSSPHRSPNPSPGPIP